MRFRLQFLVEPFSEECDWQPRKHTYNRLQFEVPRDPELDIGLQTPDILIPVEIYTYIVS